MLKLDENRLLLVFIFAMVTNLAAGCGTSVLFSKPHSSPSVVRPSHEKPLRRLFKQHHEVPKQLTDGQGSFETGINSADNMDALVGIETTPDLEWVLDNMTHYELSTMLRLMIEGVDPNTGARMNPYHPALSMPTKLPKGLQSLLSFAAAKPGDFPYQASLQDEHGYHYCGASILSRRVLITLAGCCSGKVSSQITVVAGEVLLKTTRNTTRQQARVNKMAIHPMYNKTMKHDLCLLTVEKPFTFSQIVQPARLPNSENDVSLDEDTDLVLTGWGGIWALGGDSNFLQWSVIPYIIDDTCSWTYHLKKVDPDGLMCAGSPEHMYIDACKGDHGGPLVLLRNQQHQRILVGIGNSEGDACGRPGFPGVFVRVSYYLKWIQRTLKRLNQ